METLERAMAVRGAPGRRHAALRRLSLAAAALFGGVAAVIIACPPAAAMTRFPAAAAPPPCAYPMLGSGATITSTLEIDTRGVDSPTITSTTEVTLPRTWHGVDGLFKNGKQQAGSLSCFMQVNQYEYQVAPPDVSVKQATAKHPAVVDLVNSVTVTDGPDWLPSWKEGLWSITRGRSGYSVTFEPDSAALLPPYPAWTAVIYAPDAEVLSSDRLPPSVDDGHGKVTWSLPASQKAPSPITASVSAPLPVRVDLAADQGRHRQWFNWSWALDDGVVFDVIVLLICLRLLWRRRGKADRGRCRFPLALAFIAVVSMGCYSWYVTDNALWHEGYTYTEWKWENLTLMTVGAVYLLSALGIRWFIVAAYIVPFLILIELIVYNAVSANRLKAPLYSYDSYHQPLTDFSIGNLIVELIPLALAITFAVAGTALWISRLWPAGTGSGDRGLLSPLSGTPFKNRRWAVALLIGAPVAAALILTQSAASSYYYWSHSDLWRQGTGSWTWVAADLMNDGHWWIGDGIQWMFYWALFCGVFALLRELGAAGRGVFFQHSAVDAAGNAVKAKSERRDLWMMAALAAALLVGTWGFYDGLSAPLPFAVAFAGLAAWAMTRRLSLLDTSLGSKNGAAASESFLVLQRPELLEASKRTPAGGAAAEARTGTGTGTGTVGWLPDSEDPGSTALALGPADTWWGNGAAAVQVGIYLALIPIGFDVYEWWTGGALSLLAFPFGLQDAVGNVASLAAGWITGLFLFGALVPYLRGGRTPVKGIIFGLVTFAAFAADAGLRNALGVAPYPTFVVDGLLAVALFATTGLLLDLRTLRKLRREPGDEVIDRVYQLGRVRVAVTYVTTLIVVGVSVWQAVYLTNQTAQQRAQNLSNAATYANGVAGAGHG
jgi:hypothetical protein